MTSRNLIVIGSFLIILGYWYFEKEEPRPKPAETTSKTKKESLEKPEPIEVRQERETPKAAPQILAPKTPTISANPISVRQAPKKASLAFAKTRRAQRKVTFEIHGDKAVVQKDILIGKVTSQKKVRVGEYDLPIAKLWPRGTIPFHIDKSVVQKDTLEDAISYLNEETPLNLIPAQQDDENILFFLKGDEPLCLSFVGMVAAEQPIYLDEKCGFQEILHEILHAAGLYHEQSREDRDNFVEVVWDNIKEDFYFQFEKIPFLLQPVYERTSFDFQSIMLYPPNMFSHTSGLDTMKPLERADTISPTQRGLSEGDKEKLRLLYPY